MDETNSDQGGLDAALELEESLSSEATNPDTAPDQQLPTDPEAPSPFKPISDKRIARAKRSKITLIVVIIILLIALGGLGYLGFVVLFDSPAATDTNVRPVIEIPDEALVEPSAPAELTVEETEIPMLVSLYGLTVEQIKAELGREWQLTKTDTVEDPSNPAITELATFNFIVQSETEGLAATDMTMSLPTEALYISLDKNGLCIDIYYSCDLRLLGSPLVSFNDLLANDRFVSEALFAAGIIPKDFHYQVPDFQTTIEYDNSNSDNRKILKQTTIFSGRIDSDASPVAWSLTVTYDFGAGVESPEEYKGASRTIYLKIS